MNYFETAVSRYCRSIYGRSDALKSENTFFNIWFREFGESYTFVFKKNLKVTNIQFAELISLVREHIVDAENPNLEVQFISVREYIQKFTHLFNTLFSKEIYSDKVLLKKSIRNFSDIYERIFKTMVAVDSFYGTCGIFLPYNMKINIETICFKSGYIHSCGANIYTRKIYKCTEEELFNRIHSYTEKNNFKKIPFTLYSHEDFTPFDRSEAFDFFVNGLDDLKFYVEKVFIGNSPMTTVIKKMTSDKRFKSSLDISIPGDYRMNIKGTSEKSIWLITDRSISNNDSKPGQYKYLICYCQEYINENPFHLLDENKPGWIDHVTIPHTLMGAMLNLGISNRSRSLSKMSILDPFIGSGTTLLELSKFENFVFEGSDLSPLTKIVIEDNIKFFSLKKQELEVLEKLLIQGKIIELSALLKDMDDELITDKERKILNEDLKYSKESITGKGKKFLTSRHLPPKLSSRIYNVLVSINNLISGYKYKNEKIIHKELIKYKNFEDRIFFYVGIKTLKRKEKAMFERGSEIPTLAYLKELSDFITQVRNLNKLKKRIGDKSKILCFESECHNVYFGNFSKAVSLKQNRLENITLKYKLDNPKDAIQKLNEYKEDGKKFDLIITDPPYGFNTEEEHLKFSKTFKEMLEGMVRSLSDLGQIIICLPEWSYSGRKVAFYTQRQIIIHQLIDFASQNNMELMLPSKLNPKPSWIFQPPYYWESEKALKRSIIHFCFRKK